MPYKSQILDLEYSLPDKGNKSRYGDEIPLIKLQETIKSVELKGLDGSNAKEFLLLSVSIAAICAFLWAPAEPSVMLFSIIPFTGIVAVVLFILFYSWIIMFRIVEFLIKKKHHYFLSDQRLLVETQRIFKRKHRSIPFEEMKKVKVNKSAPNTNTLELTYEEEDRTKIVRLHLKSIDKVLDSLKKVGQPVEVIIE